MEQASLASDGARTRTRVFASPAALPIVFAAAIPIVIFVLGGHVGFGKADEGFLWYGAQRVVAGEMPLRDFQSYDIGRYYWSALWMVIADDRGLVALRWSNAVLAAITVALGTAAIACVRRGETARIAMAGATLAVWMVPEYKAADAFAAVLLVVGLSRWLGDPRPRGAAAFGLCLGVAATVGINHALYGTIGGALALAWLARRRPGGLDRRAVAALGAATVAGYLPVLVPLVAAPGFAAAFVDAIRLLFEAGTTNVDAPFPRLAAILEDGGAPRFGALRESTLAALFVAAPAFVAASVVRLRRGDASPPFTAATLLAVPYAHYAWSSPTLMHVAVSGLPLLIGLFTYPSGARVAGTSPGGTATAAFVGSLFLFAHAYSAYPALLGRPLERVTVMGDALRVPPDAARELRLVQSLTSEFSGRAFFAAHDWPGAYASVGARAPNWEIYEIFAARPERQAREIARIAAADPAFVILTSGRPGDPPDGLEKTHPLIHRFVERCFVRRARDERFAAQPVEIFVAAPTGCRPA